MHAASRLAMRVALELGLAQKGDAMEVGFLTVCMSKERLEDIIAWAGASGVGLLEVHAGHLGENSPERVAAIVKALQ